MAKARAPSVLLPHGPCVTCGLRLTYHRSGQCADCRNAKGSHWSAHAEVIVAAAAPVLYGCPHCVSSHRRSCCVCRGARRVPFDAMAAALYSVWARPGCVCETCAASRAEEADLFGPVLRPILPLAG